MTRPFLSWPVYLLAFFALAMVVLLLLFDWNWLRQPIERIVTEQTGRRLEIHGDLRVHPGWPNTHIQVSDVTFANPAWAKKPLMFAIKQVDAELAIAPLFRRLVVLPLVRLRQPIVSLEESKDGRKNWLLDRQQKDTKSQIEIRRLVLDQGHLEYESTLRNASLQSDFFTRRIKSEKKSPSEMIVFNARGRFKGLPVKASGSGASLLTLSDATLPYSLNIKAELGHTRLQAAGTVTRLLHWTAADLDLTLSGDSLDQLYSLIGIALPRTPPYRTQGRLMRTAKRWHYEKFTGQMGKSDIAGNLEVKTGQKRPFLKGDLTMQLLDLADLGTLAGTENRTQNQGSATRKGGVLPTRPFRTERWNSVDADVRIVAKHIQRAQGLPIENLQTHIKMQNAVLKLDPLKFGVAGGDLSGALTLNGQRDPIHADIHLGASKIKLNKLFPNIQLTKTSIGQIHGDLKLTGNGNAMDQMLGRANGKVAFVVDGGEISKLMLETIGLHLWEMLQLKITGDEVIKINCAIADFNVKQGIMRTNAFVLDTQITTITGQGTIDLGQERLHLDLQPHTKVFSPLALRSPIYIRGNFAKPEASVDKAKIALRGAGALLLGAINPLLSLIPLIDSGPGKNSECGRMIREAQSLSR